jgi:hypothetical protein
MNKLPPSEKLSKEIEKALSGTSTGQEDFIKLL